ncbi:hypothetical protein ACWDA9_40025, partial [Streptomyces sp. NPDC001193]
SPPAPLICTPGCWKRRGWWGHWCCPGPRRARAIVHSVVRAHEGTLDLHPRQGGGLVVTVRLPGTG